MARKYTAPITRTVFTSPCGRVRIERTVGEFDLFLDSAYVRTFTSEGAALVEANVWLAEQAQHIEEYA